MIFKVKMQWIAHTVRKTLLLLLVCFVKHFYSQINSKKRQVGTGRASVQIRAPKVSKSRGDVWPFLAPLKAIV